jgi:hypothetical protein
MMRLNKTILANKILNELRYNKRYMYNWVQWFGDVGDDFTEIRKFLEVQIETTYKEIEYSTFDVGQCTIDAVPLFKKIDFLEKEPDDSSDESSEKRRERNVISFSAENKITGDIKFNLFLYSDLKTMILGSIWVEVIGSELDKNKLPDDVYANRVSQNTSSIFKPYYKAYSDFRDASFSEVKTLIENNKTGILVQTDLSKCFYSINVDELKLKIKLLLEDSGAGENVIRLNNYVFEIIGRYNNLPFVKSFTDELFEGKAGDEKQVLPIGFFPSNVLVNIYLRELDKKIKSMYNPIQYGRYVDDISFVIVKEIASDNKNDIVDNIQDELNQIKKELEEKSFCINLNSEKTLFFVISEKNDINYLKKFEKETARLSSDNHRIIDPLEFEDEFDKAYVLTKDITKLPDLFTISKDKKHLSRIISTVFYSIFGTMRKENHKSNIYLSKKFIKYFYDFVDDEFFLELYDYWYQLCTIEKISQNLKTLDEKFKKLSMFYNKLENIKSINNKSINDFVKYYEELLNKSFFDADNKIFTSLQDNFRKPRYKYNDDKYLHNYEIQLKELNKIFEHIGEEDFQKLKKEDGKNEIDYFSRLNKLIADWSKKNAYLKKNPLIIEDYEQRSILRISQANLYSYDERLKTFLKTSENLSSLSDIVTVLNESDKHNADIILFPEQGISVEDIVTVVRHAVKTKTLIVGGLDFIFINGKVLNLSIVIVPIKIIINGTEYKDAHMQLIPKIYPSPQEYDIFRHSKPQKQNLNWRMYIPKEKFNHTFIFRGYKHAFLNCYEATSMDLKYEISKEEPTLIHLITNNKDIKYYYQISESLSRDLMAVTSITNYSKLGGVQIFMPYKEEYKRIVSGHKGAKNTHVDICDINLEDINSKRIDNLNQNMKENPPKYYYRNLEEYYD